jgi:hypothetical protein
VRPVFSEILRECVLTLTQPLPGDVKNVRGSFPAPFSQARIEGTFVVLFRGGPEFQRVDKVRVAELLHEGHFPKLDAEG